MSQQKIVIIGGGVAGLSAGIYAQLNGFDATIIEMSDRPGGQLTSWKRGDYTFDYCLHWLIGTDHGAYHDMWLETNVIADDVKVVNHRIFNRYVDETHGDFLVHTSLDEWEPYLIEFAPEDRAPIRRMCNLIRRGLSFETFENPPGLRSTLEYADWFVHAARFLPALIRYRGQTCQQFFDGLGFKNQRLAFFLNRVLGSDYAALAFILMMGWMHAKNAGYLLGGSSAMSGRMADRFQNLGGQFRFGDKVTDILVENDTATGITLESGETIDADHVIAACDGHSVLFDMLQGKYVDATFREAFDTWPLFAPIVMVSFGIDDVVASEVQHTDYLVNGTHIGSTVPARYRVLNRSSYDPGFAPDGKTVLLMLFESPWEIWDGLATEAYAEEKAAILEDATRLLDTHYPGISQKIETTDVATPLTTVRNTGVWRGAFEGFSLSTDMMKTLPMRLQGLKNFTLAGQWLFPGGGQPASAQSGKWAIKMLCDEARQEFNTE
ncbi:MAG: NAD(P)/FAD-dependent oxidoreductase [Alphaproteobacteria bacterium]|nr:NAD(P)/FAD-dependent oxidoreductase [Alphaproteobacteria bacterium]